MDPKLAFKPHFRVSRLAPNLVFLLTEQGDHVLKGRHYYLMAPLLDGSRSLAEIAAELKGELPFLELYYATNRLQEQGYIIEKTELPYTIETLCHTLSIDPVTAAENLAKRRIFITGLGDVPTEPLQALLAQAHITITRDKDVADLVVVLALDYLHDQLAVFNKAFLINEQPWLLIRPAGTTPWLGPLFVKEETGCWACLGQRLRLHRRLETYLRQAPAVEELAAPPVCLPAITDTALNLAALEILKWVLQGENLALEGQIRLVDLSALEVETHVLVKRPQCPICGTPEMVTARTQRPLALQNHQSSVTAVAGYRAVPPEDTLARYAHHVSKLTGVVEALRPIQDDRPSPIYTYSAGLNVEYVPQSYAGLRNLLQNEDLGKGKTKIQAKVSALCEAIERYSSSFHGDEYRIQARYVDLGAEAIHPNACMNFSDRQYETRATWNSWPQRLDFHRVPPRFDENKVIDWTPVWSLSEQAFKYLPTAYCYFGYPDEEPSPTPACSNGNAAGNTLAEAVFQGFMELVERDSVSLWWYNRIPRPAVDLSSFEDPYIARLQAYYESMNRDLWVLDITADLNIPAFAAISRRRDAPREDIMLGFGAHFDPQVGLIKALTELNQLFSFFLKVEAGKLPQGNGEAVEWWQTATVENQPYLAPLEGKLSSKQDSYSPRWQEDLKENVLACVSLARERGLETLVLDQTQPDVGLNVVRVFVPGLRHFWRRLGPGRLYEVPAQLGWLEKPLPETDLNPYSIFI